MTEKDKLLKRLPKKYHDRIRDFYTAYDLIDDCKYMIEFNWPYAYNEYPGFPVRSITEAIEFTKEAEAFLDQPGW